MPHILGQLCTIANWWPTVLLNCNCQQAKDAGKEVNLLVLAMIGGEAECPHCHRVYKIGPGMVQDEETKLINPMILSQLKKNDRH